MQELIDKVQELVAFELERANSIHPPMFNSYHEAYAVLMEELEEAHDEYETCSRYVDLAWERIKADDKPEAINEWLEKAEKAAIRAAAECIQVAAMARKARM